MALNSGSNPGTTVRPAYDLNPSRVTSLMCISPAAGEASPVGDVLGFEGLGRETFGGVGVFALSGVEEFEMFRSGSDGGERHLSPGRVWRAAEWPRSRHRAMTSYSRVPLTGA
jgi:hypothetical protein